MRVFIPMPDEALVEPRLAGGRLVPFNPEFLLSRSDEDDNEDRRPRNWISDNDYTAACERLKRSFA